MLSLQVCWILKSPSIGDFTLVQNTNVIKTAVAALKGSQFSNYCQTADINQL